MVYGKDELLYVTGMGNIVKNKQNTEGSEMVKRYDIENNEVKVENSVLHKEGVEVRYRDMEYKENGIVYASGEGVLSTVESFLSGYLGYDLTDIDNDYEWVDYPYNKDYEVCELGLVRNKKNGKILNMSLKGKYKAETKWIWRIKVTIPRAGTKTVARVVAETFLGEKPKLKDVEGNPVKVVVGHKNDITIDNRAENLEYITADRNKTIDWVLRDVNENLLDVNLVNLVYEETLKVIEEKYGEDFEVIKLTDEDEIEVAETVDVYKRTVREIYRFVKYGIGLLSECVIIDGTFVML